MAACARRIVLSSRPPLGTINHRSKINLFSRFQFSTASNLGPGYKKLRGLTQVFPSNELPEGVTSELGFDETNALMMRQPTQEVLDALDLFKDNRASYDAKYSSQCWVLGGRPGTGKSCGLAQAVHKARSEGWVALYVPRARRLLRAAGWVAPSPPLPGEGEEEGQGGEGAARRFSAPGACREVVRAFLAAHELVLGGLPVAGAPGDTLTARYLCARAEGAQDAAAAAAAEGGAAAAAAGAEGAPRTVLELAEVGAQDPDAASHVLADLVHQLARATAAPVLVAVDEADALFGPGTGYHYAGRPLAPDDLLSPHALKQVCTGSLRMANGIVIAAASGSHPIPNDQEPLERVLAGAGAVARAYGPYGAEELAGAVGHYANLARASHAPSNPFLPGDGGQDPEALARYLRVASGGVPRLVARRYLDVAV